MAQKIRSAEGLLRVIPPPGHPATYLLFIYSFYHFSISVRQAAKKGREQRPYYLCSTILQQCTPSWYVITRSIIDNH